MSAFTCIAQSEGLGIQARLLLCSTLSQGAGALTVGLGGGVGVGDIVISRQRVSWHGSDNKFYCCF